jgi:tryptophan-rich sensory protein
MSSRSVRTDAILVAAFATVVIASLGATLTDLGPWYQGLKEPSWRPPDEAFGVIWTVIFSLAAVSASFAWRDTADARRRQLIVGLFAANGFLNVLWSMVFFRLKRPDFAMIEVGALWLSLLVLVIVTARTSKRASALLLPYLVWVAIAAVLNYEVVRLNGPFG